MKDATAILAIVVVAIAVGVLAYAYYEGYVIPERIAQEKVKWQMAQPTVTYIEPSDIRMEADPTVLNYTAAVNASDDVATQTWQNTTITFTVKEISPSKGGKTTVTLTLNPSGEEEGLPTELKQDEFEIYVYGVDGSKTYLFKDGKYTGGYTFDISENQIKELTLATTMYACQDVFEDGKTHTITLYLYEPGVGLNGAGKVIDYITLTLTT